MGVTVIGSLSPSRALDFKTCPLLYRFRCIDRLPEPPNAAATRGTLVHSVLERLFDEPPHERTSATAQALLQPAWDALVQEQPELRNLIIATDDADDTALTTWLRSARTLLDHYFELEDPSRLQPSAREHKVETFLDNGLRLRGFVDRLDVAPSGEIRVVDYKTGASPGVAFEGKALFQLKFYALVLWRTRGTVPRVLRLLYLKDRRILDYEPNTDELDRFERTLRALWSAIESATATRTFPAKPNRLCDWCAHQRICPAFGGQPPPFPEQEEPGDNSAGNKSPRCADLGL